LVASRTLRAARRQARAEEQCHAGHGDRSFVEIFFFVPRRAGAIRR